MAHCHDMNTPGMRAVVLCILALSNPVARTHGEEAAPAAAATPDQAATAMPTKEDAAKAYIWEMTKAGSGPSEHIVFPGFGGATLVASSYTLDTPAAGKWQATEASNKTLTVGSFTATLKEVPADWKTLQDLIPVPSPGDELTVRKCLWSHVSAWIIDLTLAPDAHPGLAATRQRYLIAPRDTGFLVLSFVGPANAKQFDADRPAMRDAALSVRFHINGLIAEYYNSPALDWLACFEVDPNIDYNWDTNSPANGVGPDWFSARWTGQLQPRYSETYTLTALSDDGIRVWVNDVLLIENWSDHPKTEDSGDVALKAGEKADIRVEWYENRIYAVARLFWKSLSQTNEAIPASCLSATPKPGFAPTPEYGGGSLSAPPDWPELMYTVLPGGYKPGTPLGMEWKGERPSQTMVIGEGDSTVQVSLKRIRVKPVDAKTLLPTLLPGDRIDVTKVAWRYAPANLEPPKAIKGIKAPPVVEYYASAWSVDLRLQAKNHPDTKLLYRWYCLVPLKSGMLVFCFESTNKDWCQKNWDAYRAVFDAVSLIAEDQAEPMIEKAEVGEVIF